MSETVNPQEIERVDPASQHTDAEYHGTSLRNKNPGRKYVLVYKGDIQLGVAYYRNMGYSVEEYSKDGVRLLMDDGPLDKGGARSEGQVIEYQGHVLMSIDKAKYDRLYQEGSSFSGGGQKKFDHYEKMLLSKSFDPVRLAGMRVINTSNDKAK